MHLPVASSCTVIFLHFATGAILSLYCHCWSCRWIYCHCYLSTGQGYCIIPNIGTGKGIRWHCHCLYSAGIVEPLSIWECCYWMHCLLHQAVLLCSCILLPALPYPVLSLLKCRWIYSHCYLLLLSNCIISYIGTGKGIWWHCHALYSAGIIWTIVYWLAVIDALPGASSMYCIFWHLLQALPYPVLSLLKCRWLHCHCYLLLLGLLYYLLHGK